MKFSDNIKGYALLLAAICLVLLSVFVIRVAINEKKEHPKVSIVQETSLIFDNKAVQIIPYDGCQYLYLSTNKGIIFTHKGNCVNRSHYNHVRDMVRSGSYLPAWDFIKDSVVPVKIYDLIPNTTKKDGRK